MKVLIGYASMHGSTAEVAHFMGQIFRERGVETAILAVDKVESVKEYDAFLIGSPIYAGMWLTEMSRFLDQFGADMAGKPVYFWITCIRILEPDGHQHALDNYLHRPTLEKIGARDVGVFAGKLRFETIDWNERWTLSARYDGKELPGSRNDDFRDWNAIRAWTTQVRDQILDG